MVIGLSYADLTASCSGPVSHNRPSDAMRTAGLAAHLFGSSRNTVRLCGASDCARPSS
jgi:hypothetical protein